ncbi:hypothetical protein JW968_02510 [Candidatus Woesearchaeota archaeon]|nr:hypothetical protein [Candidatus Woesearchaeota archaeon]
MRISHSLKGKKISKQVEGSDSSFIMTNRTGAFMLFSELPYTKYNGFFCNDRWSMYKVVSNLIPSEEPVEEVINQFCQVRRKRKNLTESFFMPRNHDSFVYQLDREQEVIIDLDMRQIYDYDEWGRAYDIEKVRDTILVRFTKHVGDQKKYEAYLAIRSDSGQFDMINEWIKEGYEYERQRKDSHHEWYVYRALSIIGKNFVFSFSLDREKALKEADFVFANINGLKAREEQYYDVMLGSPSSEQDFALACAQYSLDSLLCTVDGRTGIYAGLPWFFQFWTRDETISLGSMILSNKLSLVKRVLFDHLRALLPDGRLPNRKPDAKLGNADGVGWLFRRLSDFLRHLDMRDDMKIYLSLPELYVIKEKLEKSISQLFNTYAVDGLIWNKELETWMDTHIGGQDARSGVRIEIQALTLCMFDFWIKLSEILKMPNVAKSQRDSLKKKIRQEFFKDGRLADGIDDMTQRPNVFLTYYIYPKLFSKAEWKRIFDSALDKLWLGWGGISTIEKDHPLFRDTHTGTDNMSYHRGDSWFWINNLAALCMHQVDSKYYQEKIDRIVSASTNEILYSGAIGHHAEISSASRLESRGCFSQAWSSAMLIELIHVIRKNKKRNMERNKERKEERDNGRNKEADLVVV